MSLPGRTGDARPAVCFRLFAPLALVMLFAAPARAQAPESAQVRLLQRERAVVLKQYEQYPLTASVAMLITGGATIAYGACFFAFYDIMTSFGTPNDGERALIVFGVVDIVVGVALLVIGAIKLALRLGARRRNDARIDAIDREIGRYGPRVSLGAQPTSNGAWLTGAISF